MTIDLKTVEAARDRYAELLLEEDALDQTYKTALASFEEKHADLIAQRKEARKLREQQEEYLRSSAVELYKATPEAERKKQLTLGVEVEDRTKVDISNPEVVTQLLQFGPLFLMPNEKAIRDVGEAAASGKKHLLEALQKFVPALKISREPQSAIGGVKTMGEVLQVNAAKQVMATFETAVPPVRPAKPVSKKRAQDEEHLDLAVDTAAAALDLVN